LRKDESLTLSLHTNNINNITTFIHIPGRPLPLEVSSDMHRIQGYPGVEPSDHSRDQDLAMNLQVLDKTDRDLLDLPVEDLMELRRLKHEADRADTSSNRHLNDIASSPRPKVRIVS
jgi:hypothetical protein